MKKNQFERVEGPPSRAKVERGRPEAFRLAPSLRAASPPAAAVPENPILNPAGSFHSSPRREHHVFSWAYARLIDSLDFG
jgi:hypothetical protein